MKETPRRLKPLVDEALANFRVVVITGPRQAGKTTLVRRTIRDAGTFARLDDEATLEAARADPTGFARFGPTPRAFDEIQRGGDPLIRAIKSTVDENRAKGQFLLNGSADFLTVPTISESLAGRAAFLELWPFTQGELEGGPDGLLEKLFSEPEEILNQKASKLTVRDYHERLCLGGFPEAVTLKDRARRTWYENYIRTVTQRDIRELTGARRSRQLPNILALLASTTAGELVVSRIHEDSGLGSHSTTDDYISYLQMVYLVNLLPAWSRNLTKKVARHPKVHIGDSGLAAHILGKSPDALARPTDPARGPLLETFVFNELLRQASWLEDDIRLYHFRERDGAEIDFVAERADGQVVAVEVKTSSSVTAGDTRWLKWLRKKVATDFVSGVVLYTGERPYRLDDRLYALPISYLWSTG